MNTAEASPIRSFSLVRKTQTIEIEGQRFVLTELTGTERDKHIQDSSARMDKNGRVTNFMNIQAVLIQTSIRKEGSDTVLPLAEIQKWPSTAQTEIYLMCRLLSGLDTEKNKAEEEAKND